MQEILSMDLAPVDRAAEINAFMQTRFNQRSRTGPPPRGRPTQPGRFQTSRSASAPARPPPRDKADVQCINCNRKGFTAQECRQPKVDNAQRTCLLCNKTGHIARDCKERPAPIQAIQQQPLQRGSQDPACLGCVQVADPDGFIPVRRGLRAQDANLGDFIRASTADRKSHAARSNRFRELTVDDLNVIATSEVASRGGGHPLLKMAGKEPKLAVVQPQEEFPPLRPSVQGEECGLSTRPLAALRPLASAPALRPLASALPPVPYGAFQAQTDFSTFRAYLHDPILRAAMSDHPMSSQDVRVFRHSHKKML